MAQLQSYTFDELPIGKKATYTRTVTEQDIALFAVVSGDVNPLHLDAEFAKGTMFGERIAHGMMTGAIVSAALVMALTGPGAIYRSQSLRFRRPVKIGDVITVLAT
jgi:3-hydroxybutyryl-CoA dehydratase